jgi:hypothetical protein
MTPFPVTVLIPTSPIPAHPSTEIILKVIESIRWHLPASLVDIYILCDGVRPEVEHRREQYQEYLDRLRTFCADTSRHVFQVLFDTPTQQAGMVKRILPTIKTQNIFFCEHDATIDAKPIPWDTFYWMLVNGEANTIRLYWHQEDIHEEHLYLMRGREGDFVKTVQWSSWPLITRTRFLRALMEKYFPDGDDCVMTETRLYSPVVESPWEENCNLRPQPDAIRFIISTRALTRRQARKTLESGEILFVYAGVASS